ncbi:MAG: hypothetical protein WAW17_01035 [Rhodococcus sp. (in: high G+C Gram-positive bacteria)]|uniref:hypothetical protein n=1 Tax=Rhodococcus sp. TaxID=1831 RepID=UPI003BAEE29E
MSKDVLESDVEQGESKMDVAGSITGENAHVRVKGRQIGVGRLAIGLLIIGLGAAVCVLGFVLSSKSDTIASMTARQDGQDRAAQIALDYAVGAADMNFTDLPVWNERLTKGVSPELSAKLTQAATSMEQVITPLQWVSTAEPIAAKVESESGGVYVVNAFVSVLTKNSQAPGGVQSTATYAVTVDSNSDWSITDVGGVDGALGAK